MYQYVVPLTMRCGELHRERSAGRLACGWLHGAAVRLPRIVGERVDNRSLWCNSEFFFYECADTPQTTNFHPALLNPRNSAGHYWFDTTPFSLEPLGTFGNVKRNFSMGRASTTPI